MAVTKGDASLSFVSVQGLETNTKSCGLNAEFSCTRRSWSRLYHCCDVLECASTFESSVRMRASNFGCNNCREVSPQGSMGTTLSESRKVGPGGCRLRARLYQV